MTTIKDYKLLSVERSTYIMAKPESFYLWIFPNNRANQDLQTTILKYAENQFRSASYLVRVMSEVESSSPI